MRRGNPRVAAHRPRASLPSRSLPEDRMAAPPAALADAPAHRLERLFASGEASPVEACRAVLARIERLNPEYRAFVRVDAEGALAAARASETRWRGRSPLGPLDGVPVSIKDLILTKG